MKRKDIIELLINEGLTDKTLVNMSDKQLRMLAERFVSEQYTTYTTATQTPGANSPSILNIPRTDQAGITTAKQQRKTFATYEGEMKEDLKLGAEKKEYNDKEKAIKSLKFKIEHEKDKNKVKEYKKMLDELEKSGKKKKEVDEGEEKPKFKSKTEWLKSKGIIKDDATEETDVEDKPEKSPAKKEEKKKQSHKELSGGSEYQKRAASGNAGFSLNEWVNKAVEKNIHLFTSKSEIMGLIDVKLNEQTKPREDDDDTMTMAPPAPQHAPAPKETEVEPDVKRPTKPGVDPDDPFRDPHPGINPNPKAEKKEKISAREAKDKIIELMRQMLQ